MSVIEVKGGVQSGAGWIYPSYESFYEEIYANHQIKNFRVWKYEHIINPRELRFPTIEKPTFVSPFSKFIKESAHANI